MRTTEWGQRPLNCHYTITSACQIPTTNKAQNIPMEERKTEDLKKEMSDFSSNFTNTHNKDTPIDILWSLFKNSCNELLNKFVPSKTTSSRFSQPWINSDIKRLSRNKKKNLQQSNRIKNFQRLGTLQSLEIKVPI